MSSRDLGVGTLFEYLEMGFTEGMSYVLFKNPISSTVIDSVKGLANSGLLKNNSSSAVKLPKHLENLPVSKLVLIGSPFVRLAGICGASAAILGAYGAHTFYVKEGYEEQKRIYQTANTYHFIHSLALFGVPLSRHPKVAGSLLTLGMLLFCGTCYYDAFTGRTYFRKLTPIDNSSVELRQYIHNANAPAADAAKNSFKADETDVNFSSSL